MKSNFTQFFLLCLCSMTQTNMAAIKGFIQFSDLPCYQVNCSQCPFAHVCISQLTLANVSILTVLRGSWREPQKPQTIWILPRTKVSITAHRNQSKLAKVWVFKSRVNPFTRWQNKEINTLHKEQLNQQVSLTAAIFVWVNEQRPSPQEHGVM